MHRWLEVAGRRDVVVRAAKVAAVVGTLLVAINQGDALLSGQVPLDVLAKIMLTYCVPYGVSTYSSVKVVLAATNRDDD